MEACGLQLQTGGLITCFAHRRTMVETVVQARRRAEAQVSGLPFIAGPQGALGRDRRVFGSVRAMEGINFHIAAHTGIFKCDSLLNNYHQLSVLCK